MNLKAQFLGLEHDVSLELNAGVEAVTVEVDGRRYDVEIRELADGQYLFVVGARVSKARVERRQGTHGATGLFDVSLGGKSYEIAIVDPKRLRTGETTAAHGAGAAEIISPMPGKVVRVLVETGAQVEAGDGIVVVEAMKMQNELKAPKAGTVISINAEVGATVSAGDVLAVIE